MRPEKPGIVKDIADKIRRSSFIFFVAFRGMNNADVTELRTRLIKIDSSYQVVKITFLLHALRDANTTEPDNLNGELAIVLGRDLGGTAKTLVQYFRESKRGRLSGGILSPRLLTTTEIEAIAELPSHASLFAQLLGLLSQPAATLLATLNEPASMLARLLAAKSRPEEGADGPGGPTS